MSRPIISGRHVECLEAEQLLARAIPAAQPPALVPVDAPGPVRHRQRSRMPATLRQRHAQRPRVAAAIELLQDGRRVLVRMASRADRQAVQQFVRGLSTASRYNRFFAPVRELSNDQLTRITRSSLPDALAVVAEAIDESYPRIVALAQYASCEPRVAEFAVVVDDRWQRQGLGSHLLRTLGMHAARAGIARLTGMVLTDNWPMLTLLARCGCELAEDAYDRVIHAALSLGTSASAGSVVGPPGTGH